MSELRQSVTIVNKRGLHARASAKFVGAVAELEGDVRVAVAKDGNSAAGGASLGRMRLAAAKGDTVEVVVEGDGAQGVLDDLVALIADGFGEE